MSAVAFRPFLPADAEVLADLFRDSIEELAQEHYDDDQRAAWASYADDLESFRDKLGKMLTVLAVADGQILGFAGLRDENHIEMLYIAPDFARQGIGNALCDVIELFAAKRNATALTVDASDVSKEFFEKRGFEAQKRNTVLRAGEWIANTTMKKTLPAAPATGNA